MDSMVQWVGGVGVYYPNGIEAGPEKRFLGGNVEGEALIHPFELLDHLVGRKERYMHISRHSGLPNRGKERLKTVKRGRMPLVVSCRRTKEGYVVDSLNDSNKETKTSQPPRHLY